MLRIGLCQMRVHPGEAVRNTESMLRSMEEFRGKADLLVFPELCVPGYLLGDLWERPAFLRDCEYGSKRLVEATERGPAIVFGNVAVDWDRKGEDGRPRKYNACVAAAGGKALEHPGLKRPYGIKTLLPNYREFEDSRHFYDARKLALEENRPWSDFVEPLSWEIAGHRYRIGITLCEDAWEDDYAQKPMHILAHKHPDFVLNLSASPFTRGKNDKRHRVFGAKAKMSGVPLLYVNCTGIQNNAKTIYTFDGSSTIYRGDGSVQLKMPAYAEKTTIVELPLIGTSDVGAPLGGAPAAIAEIHAALRYGTEKFLESTGRRKVVVGISGGIDSAVSAALFREFLSPDELLLVNMPSRFNSQTTIGFARALAKNLDCLYTEMSIEESLDLSRKQMGVLEAVSPDGKTRIRLNPGDSDFENVQARDRGARILAALASAFGGVFACNTNKAELTVGYGTLYGDIAGFLAPLGDLWKEDVYALGRYLNTEAYQREVIPEGMFTLIPSAELSAAQAVDEGKGDPLHYPYHDKLFHSWVQRWNRATPEENLEWYAAGTLTENLGLGKKVDLKRLFPTPLDFITDLERWWNLYNGIAVAKRVQAPPILAVSSRAFGYDHREFLGQPGYTEGYRMLKKRVLGE